MLIEIDDRQLGTILAALRVYQGSEDISEEIREIATDGGTIKALSNAEIDDLCEGINGGALQCDERKYLLVMVGDLEPEIHGAYVDDKARDRAARRYRKRHGNDDGIYRLNVTGHVAVDSYMGKELRAKDPNPTLAGLY